MMKEAPRRKIDKTSIKEAGLKSVKPCRDIQGVDFIDENINGVAEEDQWMIEEFNVRR